MNSPTPQQQAIIKAISTPGPNLIIRAYAGTGKTSVLVAGVAECSPIEEIICCAFNKKIAVELQDRMPGNASCGTLHSFGLKALSKSSDQKVRVESKKTWIIRDKLGMDDNFPGIRQLVGLAKSSGIVPSDMGSGLVEDTVPNWLELIEDHEIDVGLCPDPVDQARDLLRASIEEARRSGMVDFDDMLYLPAIWRLTFPPSDLVMVDEAQDLSSIQHRMLELMTAGSRLCAVGDPHQAIYRFRGADSDSMDKLERKWNCTQLPLSISFRCPKAVVKEAQQWVPEIESAPAAAQGVVERRDVWRAGDISPGDVVLCRNNKPLMKLCLQLIRSRKGAVILGRDIAEGLVSIIKKVDEENLAKFMGALGRYGAERYNYFMSRSKDSAAEAFSDRVDAILAVAEELPSTNTKKDLVRVIESMFSDKQGLITLSTIHKAKGMEWERVWFLDRFLIPSKFAKREADLRQEHNLLYVGVTRSKRDLFYINSMEQKP